MSEIAEPCANDYVRRLRRLDCCAISDAMDHLEIAGVVSGLMQRSGSGRIAGCVVTVKLGLGEAPPGPKRHLGCNAIEKSGSYDVIVIEQHTGIDCAGWGGLLSLAAQHRGVAGVIVDGPVRDVDEGAALKFPVFSRSVTARTARNRIVEKGTDLPLTIGPVAVRAGDYVIADGSGVAFIRVEDIVLVLDAAELIDARECVIARAMLAGTPASEAMGSNYEHILKA
jgi:4-hydroxy-4-methyl-2-oxoglutarate aldolase